MASPRYYKTIGHHASTSYHACHRTHVCTNAPSFTYKALLNTSIYDMNVDVVLFPGLVYRRLLRRQKRSTCFATLQQNEVNSDVARFTTHVRTCLATNKVARFLLLGGKRRNIAIQFVWSKVAKQVARFCRPFYAVP